jgi:peroxiredoxin
MMLRNQLVPIFLCLGTLVGCAGEESTTILTPDGQPAAGATVVIVPPGHWALVTDAQTIDNDPAYQRYVVSASGRLRLLPATRPFLIVAVHSSGYLDIDHLSGKKIHLEPWGQIEGKFLVGSKPGANQNVMCWAAPDQYDPDEPDWEFQTQVRSDPAGNFYIPKAPAGDLFVAARPSEESLERPLEIVEVQEGQISHIVIGGHGRPVSGRVILPAEFSHRSDWNYRFCDIIPQIAPPPSPMPVELKQAPLIRQAAWWRDFESSDAGARYRQAKKMNGRFIERSTHEFQIQPDGTFRIENVDAGSYSLHVNIYQPYVTKGSNLDGGYGTCEFTVPPIAGGRSDDPLQIPPVHIDPTFESHLADTAPDFSAPGFDGSTIKLSDFRGKYVLLVFWATWCGPCLGETRYLKQVYATYGLDKRFVMIGLSFDEQPNDPMQYTQKKGLNWRQGFLGDMETSPVASAYGVGGIPMIWLISPEGKIAAMHLRGDRTLAAVAAALKK